MQAARIGRRVLLLGIGVAIIIFLLWRSDRQAIFEGIIGADLILLLLALLLSITNALLMMHRWILLYGRTSGPHSCRIYLLGQGANQVAPMGSGELVRAYVGSRYYGVPSGETLTPAVIERILDILLFMVMAVICLVFVVVPEETHTWQVGAALIVMGSLLGVGLFILRNPRILERISIRLERLFKSREGFVSRITGKIRESIESFTESTLDYHKKKGKIGAGFAMTLLIWTVDAMGQLVILNSLGADLSYYHVVIVLSIAATAFIVGALSFLPGGLGAREFVFSMLMTIFLVSRGFEETHASEVALSAALIYKVLVYLVIGCGALWALSTLPPKIKKKKKRSDIARKDKKR